jgi:hypothetical protein
MPNSHNKKQKTKVSASLRELLVDSSTISHHPVSHPLQFLENVELAVSFKDISAHSEFLLGMALSQTPSRSKSAGGGKSERVDEEARGIGFDAVGADG